MTAHGSTRRQSRRRPLLAAAAAAALVISPALAQTSPARASNPAAPWSGNLLTGDNATFDHGVGGWFGVGDTMVSRNTIVRNAGAGSLDIMKGGANAGFAIAQSGHDASTYQPAVPGQRYRGSFYVRALATERPTAATITFFDASTNIIMNVQGQYRSDSNRRWNKVIDVAAVAPPNARYVALRVGIKGAAPLERHVIDSAYLSHATVNQTNVVAPLRTVGNKIYDGANRQIVLRGFSRAGLEGQVRDDGSTEDLPTADDISHARGWGANVIRLPLGEQKWLPGTCHTDSGYVTKVDNAVSLVTSRGMIALLDLHFNQSKPCGTPHQQAMADAPNSLTFWQQVATRFKSNRLVAFDLYNEPHNISEAVWRNGGTATYQGVSFKAAGMQQMYNTVRAAGAQNLVVVTGLSWGNLPPANGPLTGNNIAYGVHSYTCPQQPPPNCTGHADPYNGAAFLRGWVNFAKTHPVVVSEFGWPDPRESRYTQSLISYAEAHGFGWLLFTWADKLVGRFDLVAGSGFGTETNYQPAPVAMPALLAMPS
jgi:hypothetical protein